MSDTINATFHFPGTQPEYDVEGFIRTLQRTAELTPDQIAAIRERRPVSPEQYQAAQQAHERFKQDNARVRKFFDGDIQTRNEVMQIRLTLGSRVKAPD
jgi:hypothetical protein